MPPKKKAKKEPQAQEVRSASSSETLIMPGPLESVPATIYGVNEGYMKIVMSNVITIKEAYPGIHTWDPLPISGDTGYQGLVGFGVPFSPTVFDEMVADDSMSFATFINYFWQDIYTSVLPYVPLYYDDVEKLANTTTLEPVLMRTPFTMHCDHVHGTDVPKGGLP